MKCHEAATLHRFVDDELDVADRGRFTRHLDECALCSRELAATTALRAGIRRQVPYFAAPPDVRARLLDTVARQVDGHETADRPARRSPVAARIRRRVAWIWLGTGAAAGSALTLAALTIVVAIGAWSSNRSLVDEVVAAHGRSSLTGHVVDIGSADQHSVKPWLSQRLDYSPPVVDLHEQGFPLIGGRLDRIDGASIATLVYRHGQHRIDVFVRPLSDAGRAFEATSLRGYNVVQSRGMGMQWIGVSDVNQPALQRLVDELASPSRHPPSPEPRTQ